MEVGRGVEAKRKSGRELFKCGVGLKEVGVELFKIGVDEETVNFELIECDGGLRKCGVDFIAKRRS